MIRHSRSIINYSIKRRMQLRLLFRVMIIALIGVSLTSAVFYLYSNKEIGYSYQQFHIQAKSFLDFLLPAIVISLIIGIVIAFAIAIFFPHKIAGPLYRLEREIKEKVGEGDLTVNFYVRKGDEIQDLAEALNIMVKKLRVKVENIKTLTEGITAHSADVHGENDSLKKVVEMTKKLEEAVHEFKL